MSHSVVMELSEEAIIVVIVLHNSSVQVSHSEIIIASVLPQLTKQEIAILLVLLP